MGASPIYTKRMQKALKYEGDDVITIFKGLQLDIGAPPQFMDFRYTVHDRWHGEFHLDHCGALLDVEPMGEDYVRGMCHDIEDPTFDATAVATNRKAQIRPIHRPPRVPADRHPHCAWTVIIDESYPEVGDHPGARCHSPNPRRQNRTRPDRSRWRRTGGLLGRAAVGFRLRRVLTLRAGAHRRRGVPADAPAEPVLCHRRGQARGHQHRTCEGDLHQTAHRHRRHRRRTHSSRARSAGRDRGCDPHARTASDVQSGGIREGRVRAGHVARASITRPRGRGVGLVGRLRSRSGRCRRLSPRWTHTSTWR